MSFYRSKAGQIKKKKGRVDPPRCSGYKVGDEVRIEVGRAKCKFLTPFPKAVEKAMSAPVPGYFFTPQFKGGYWDGQHHFITRIGYFPTGLLPLVYHVLITGLNPMVPEEKKAHKILVKPVHKVVVIVPENMRGVFYSGSLSLWEDFNVLETLDPDTGTFAYPVKLLNRWKKETANPIAEPLLAFCKSLKTND